ncbi:putative O-methyltransferase 3 [Senna tora]|uniref:isoflavone 7-O-methyltransferase n=1 Tax=Senna tora TaxID=362788 RepID=A0A834XEB8_9FABA|nr:putative O-methyltransferase 3 [Senna tora]
MPKGKSCEPTDSIDSSERVMESQHEEEQHIAASKLLDAQIHLWNHVLSFINSMSLKSAIDLNIPDIIHKHAKPMPLPSLISSLQIHPSQSPNIHRLMRILTHSGFFSQSKEGYVLTHASTLLLKDNPFSVSPFLLAMLDPVLIKPWFHVASWFKNGEDPTTTTPFGTAHGGKTLWEYARDEAELNGVFNEAMASDARVVASVVMGKCKRVFEGLECLVDVGGGTGTVAKAIAKAFPQMECTVFDLPHVVEGQEDSGNLKFVGGDMFQDAPLPPADAILLKSILHDWNDEECVKILKKCKESLASKGKDGKLILIEIIMKENYEKGDMDDESIMETQLYLDMLMMVMLTGKERNEKDGYVDWKREKRERMGQIDILCWFQSLQNNSRSGFKISH